MYIKDLVLLNSTNPLCSGVDLPCAGWVYCANCLVLRSLFGWAGLIL